LVLDVFLQTALEAETPERDRRTGATEGRRVTPARPALFVLTSMVEDWIGEGPAIIHWAALDRGTQRLPWPLADMIADADELEREQEPAVVNAVSRFFTADEAQALGSVLVKEKLMWDASLRCGRVELPMTSDEALSLQHPNPHSPHTMWRIRPPAPVLP